MAIIMRLVILFFIDIDLSWYSFAVIKSKINEITAKNI